MDSGEYRCKAYFCTALQPQRYGIYFNYTANSGAFNVTKYLKDKETARFENAKQDVVQPGYGQYENDEDHNMQESNSVGQTSDGTSRYAKAGGYFIYTMKTAPNEDNVLEVTFRGADEGNPLKSLLMESLFMMKFFPSQRQGQPFPIPMSIP